MEYDFARQHQKPIFILLTDDYFIPDNEIHQSDEETELQRSHRHSVMASGHKWELFSQASDLRLKVSQAIRRIDRFLGRPPIFYRHIPRSPAYFAGRSREMQQIHEALLRDTPAIIVVVGMGGQGKTTLVHQALLEHRGSAFNSGYWCTAYRGGYTFDIFLDDVLSYFLKKDFDKRELPDVDTRVSHLLRLLQEQPTLIVIDGVERWLWGWNLGPGDPLSAANQFERTAFHPGLDDFLQQSGLGNGTHLVLTTRALPAALDQAARVHIPVREENGENLSLEGLDSQAAIDLLTKLGIKGTVKELEGAAAPYGNHPLALTILAMLVKKKYGGVITRLPSITPWEPGQELNKLFDEIRGNLVGGKKAEQLLKVASLCLENPTLSALAAGMAQDLPAPEGESKALLETVVMLADWHLLGWEGVTQRVSLHPLIKKYFRSLLSQDEESTFHYRLSRWYSTLPISEAATALEDVGTHILAIKHALLCGKIDYAADLMFLPKINDNSFLRWLGFWGHQFAAIELLGQLAQASQKELRGHFLLARAQMYHQLARPQQALEEVEEAREIFQSYANAGILEAQVNLAKAWGTRGNIIRETDRTEKAIPDFDKAIAILNRLIERLPRVKWDLARSLVNRGNAWTGIGSLRKAISDYNKACLFFEELETNDPLKLSLAQSLTNRGLARLRMGDIPQALVDFERANSLYASPVHERQEDLARFIAHMKGLIGHALRVDGKLEKALLLTSEAVETLEKLVDVGRKDAEHLLALYLMQRAQIFLTMSQWEEGNKDCDRSVLIYQRLVTEAGPHFNAPRAQALCLRGFARYQLGDEKRAAEDRRQGLDATRNLLERMPKESEIRLGFLRDLLMAVDYLLPSDKDEAKALLEELTREWERVFSPEDSTEALRVEVQRALPLLMAISSKLTESSLGTSEIKLLIKKTQQLAENHTGI